MTKQGHFKIGVGVALAGAALTYSLTHNAYYAAATFTLAALSSSIPDTLEIPIWRKGERYSIIPHRTITHWVPAWALLVGAIAWQTLYLGSSALGLPEIAELVVYSIAIGALGHCIADMMTPMGVPVILPFWRNSLYVCASGSAENFIAILSFAIGGGLLCVSLGILSSS
ncbi:MAG: metal-dependent hydrolase [Zetaproteobacteria bacterium]|nr:metal-dependent hydrolase [Zetaproteobacteria bacterium]